MKLDGPYARHLRNLRAQLLLLTQFGSRRVTLERAMYCTGGRFTEQEVADAIAALKRLGTLSADGMARLV